MYLLPRQPSHLPRGESLTIIVNHTVVFPTRGVGVRGWLCPTPRCHPTRTDSLVRAPITMATVAPGVPDRITTTTTTTTTTTAATDDATLFELVSQHYATRVLHTEQASTRIVGRGASSRVYAVSYSRHDDDDDDNSTNTALAVRCVMYRGASGALAAYEEQALWSTLRHVNVVPMLSCFSLAHDVHSACGILVCEMPLARCTLLDLLHARGVGSEEVARRRFVQVAGAVAYLHDECRVVHHDVKLENIVVFPGYTATGHEVEGTLKLIDFGFAHRVAERVDAAAPAAAAAATAATYEPCRHSRGSIDYVSPQMLIVDASSGGVVFDGMAADAWAVGCVLYMLLSGSMPFDMPRSGGGGGGTTSAPLRAQRINRKRIVRDNILHRRIRPFLQAMTPSPDALDLLEGLLCAHEKPRLTARQARDHVWCTGAVAQSQFSGRPEPATFHHLQQSVPQRRQQTRVVPVA